MSEKEGAFFLASILMPKRRKMCASLYPLSIPSLDPSFLSFFLPPSLPPVCFSSPLLEKAVWSVREDRGVATSRGRSSSSKAPGREAGKEKAPFFGKAPLVSSFSVLEVSKGPEKGKEGRKEGEKRTVHLLYYYYRITAALRPT